MQRLEELPSRGAGALRRRLATVQSLIDRTLESSVTCEVGGDAEGAGEI